MKSVEIYSTESCHFCHLAKEFFGANSIHFVEYNVGKDTARRAEMVEITGQMGVPVIVVGNQDVVVGFDEKKIRELLMI